MELLRLYLSSIQFLELFPPTPDQVFGYKGGVGPYLPESQRKGCWGWEEKEGKGKGLILCFFTTINDMNKSERCMIK